MKIGIVTQPLMSNYGGIMQNYALQQVLIKLGHNPETIHYKRSKKYYIKNTFLTILSNIKTLCMFPFPAKRRKFKGLPRCKMTEANRAFITNNIQLSYPTTKYRYNPLYDCYIVGSDQVWRPRYNEHIADMYLQFVQDKSKLKLAYAVSFGVDKWEYDLAETKLCQNLAAQFKAISVREISGIYLCEHYLKAHAQKVLDPTLLLTTEQYCKLCRQIPVVADKLLGCYFLDDNSVKQEVALQVSRKVGLKPVYVPESKGNIFEWLAMFRDARFIITDSFHGSVFSIIFHKPFIAIGNKARGIERFITLFSELGLTERLVINALKDDYINLVSKDIDWIKVSTELEKYKAKSIAFLHSNLSNNGIENVI